MIRTGCLLIIAAGAVSCGFILKMGSLPELMAMTGPTRLKLRNFAPVRVAGLTAVVSIIPIACAIH